MALFLPGVSSSEDTTCTTLPDDLCYLVGGSITSLLLCSRNSKS
jgi:hypothetical protein